MVLDGDLPWDLRHDGQLLFAEMEGTGRCESESFGNGTILPYDGCLPVEYASKVMMFMLLFTFEMTSPRYRHDVSYAMRAVLFDALTQSFTRA